jgi:hypothetical protein
LKREFSGRRESLWKRHSTWRARGQRGFEKQRLERRG